MQSVFRCVLAAAAMIVFLAAAAAAETAAVSAEGRYVLGDLDTKQSARTLALLEAKRIALEKAGTYVESVSEVRDSRLTKDEIVSLAAGLLSVEIVKEDWQTAGESITLTLSISAIVDTTRLKERIEALHGPGDPESVRAMKAQIDTLRKELDDLKVQQKDARDKTADLKELTARNDAIVSRMSALDALREGFAAAQVKNHRTAVAAFSRALEIDPDMADAYAGMALSYRALGDRHKAEDMLDRAVRINSDTPAVHFATARIRFSEKRYEQALEAIDRAITLRPGNASYYWLRAHIREKLALKEKALEDYARACRMNLPRACRQAEALKN
jgi:tetratricopeptide (TPR) repeat protein